MHYTVITEQKHNGLIQSRHDMGCLGFLQMNWNMQLYILDCWMVQFIIILCLILFEHFCKKPKIIDDWTESELGWNFGAGSGIHTHRSSDTA